MLKVSLSGWSSESSSWAEARLRRFCSFAKWVWRSVCAATDELSYLRQRVGVESRPLLDGYEQPRCREGVPAQVCAPVGLRVGLAKPLYHETVA